MPTFKSMYQSSKRALRYIVDLEQNRKFDRWPGSYRGIFASFEEARASAPSDKIGFDHPELASLYDSRIGKAFPSDYPVLFWFARFLKAQQSVFDWGGHVGISYYTFSQYLDFPPGLRWRVGDVPAIVKAGRELAEKRGASALTFTTEFGDADGFDVMLVNGCIQFVETPFDELLRGLNRRPEHLVINKVPLHDGPQFITLENTVHSYNPYKVGNRASFIDLIGKLGYRQIDAWENPDVTCHIPLHRDRSIHAYSGFYFKLDS